MFAGDPAPFVMELPAYHMPTVMNLLRSACGKEAGHSLRKPEQLSLLSTILVWFTTYFGFVDGAFTMLTEDQIDYSVFLQQSVKQFLGYLLLLAGVTGRQQLHQLQVLLLRKISLVHWVFFTVQATVLFIRIWLRNLSAIQRIFIPCIQPALRTLFRRNGCYQA